MKHESVNVTEDAVLGGIHAAMSSDDGQLPVHSSSLRVMGTGANVTTVGGPADLPLQIENLLHTLNQRWSRFLGDSELSNLNNAPGVPQTVSEETLRLFQEMARGFSLTDGQFDPTVLPALIAEGYSHSLVNPELITRIPAGSPARGNFSRITVDGQKVTLPAGTTVDSGGLGKGLAADMAIELAMSSGALGALVEIGGDVRVAGLSPRSDRWRLGIEDPHESGKRRDVVEIRHQGLATSTITKRRFTSGDRDTHHIINPETRHSSQSDTVQASVIAATAVEAEIWTKVAFVRGSSELLRQAQRKGFHAACVLESGEWLTSSGWPSTDA